MVIDRNGGSEPEREPQWRGRANGEERVYVQWNFFLSCEREKEGEGEGGESTLFYFFFK